jgi:hypothetical protein
MRTHCTEGWHFLQSRRSDMSYAPQRRPWIHTHPRLSMISVPSSFPRNETWSTKNLNLAKPTCPPPIRPPPFPAVPFRHQKPDPVPANTLDRIIINIISSPQSSTRVPCFLSHSHPRASPTFRMELGGKKWAWRWRRANRR